MANSSTGSMLRPMSTTQPSSLRFPASTVRNCPSTAQTPKKVGKQHRWDGNAPAPDSKLRAPASISRTEHTERTTEQRRKGNSRTLTTNSTIRVPASTAREYGRRQKESRQPRPRTPGRQTKAGGAAASSVAETSRDGAIQELDLMKRLPQEVAKRREDEGLGPRQHLSWFRMSEETAKGRTPIVATAELSKSERGWTCWVCEKGLPLYGPEYSASLAAARRSSPVTWEVTTLQTKRARTGTGESRERPLDASGSTSQRSSSRT